MTEDEVIMSGCIELARKGSGHVSPNPLVGCIIFKNGEIIGKGYHKRFGENHAEVNAVADAKKKGFDVSGSTVYTSLEPCSHIGKTASCADLLIKENVGKVIIGMKDPYEEVNGRGIKKLIKAGIETQVGVLENECKELNRFFIKFVTKKLPYVSLKVAQSIDGKIALDNYISKWITGEASRKYVHQLRSEYDVVLIGKNTAKYDNPSLTVRDVRGRTPYRIVIDKDSTLPENLKLFTDSDREKTFVISGISKKSVTRIYNQNIIRLDDKRQKIVLKDILRKFYTMNISSVLVEGGANIYSQFVKSRLFDDIYFFIAPKIIGRGISTFRDFEVSRLAEARHLEIAYTKTFEKDLLIYAKKCSRG